MRLAGQAKGGFYPAAPEAVAFALKHLNAEPAMAKGGFAVLDPCAGEGQALKQITDATGGTPFAIELEEGRGAKCKALFADRALSPASLFGCKAGAGAFSLMWVNPPYDDEMGGDRGRVEHKFLMHVTGWLRPGGVMMFVVPERIVADYSPSKTYLMERFDDCRLLRFPNAVRKYNEVVVMGYRREKMRDTDEARRLTYQPFPEMEDMVYHVPASKGPRVFEKVQLTTTELGRALGRSPLRRYFAPKKEVAFDRPPLSLNKGHVAMMLASGQLDGVVAPEGEPMHVVRGVAQKQPYLKESTEEEKADGSVTRRQVWGEKIILTVRAVWPDGTIKTFSQE